MTRLLLTVRIGEEVGDDRVVGFWGCRRIAARLAAVIRLVIVTLIVCAATGTSHRLLNLDVGNPWSGG